MAKPVMRVGVLTGGGDAPGLNAAIRAVTKTLIHKYKAEVVGFRDSYSGLVFDNTIPLSFDAVSNILTRGGTLLGTSNKGNFFGVKRNESQTVKPGRDRTKDALRVFKKHRLKSLICIGGDGTLTVARHLELAGMPVIGVPKTIDNDVQHTDQTFGFDTACSIATEAVDRLHSTAVSHKRVMIVEVMGRSAGWIALHAGLAGGGDLILIPEIPFDMKAVCAYVRRRFSIGRTYCLVVVSEGAYKKGTVPIWKKQSHALSGVSHQVAKGIIDGTGTDCRATVLGHLQRGGTPTAFDRILASRYGHAAAVMAAEGRFGRMTAFQNNQIVEVPLSEVAGHPRRIPLDSPLIDVARSVGVSFGESRVDRHRL